MFLRVLVVRDISSLQSVHFCTSSYSTSPFSRVFWFSIICSVTWFSLTPTAAIVLASSWFASPETVTLISARPAFLPVTVVSSISIRSGVDVSREILPIPSTWISVEVLTWICSSMLAAETDCFAFAMVNPFSTVPLMLTSPVFAVMMTLAFPALILFA